MTERLTELQADLARLNAEAEELAESPPGTDMILAGGDAEDARKALRVHKLRLEQQKQEIEKVADAMKAEMERMADAALAAIGPLEDQMQKLQEGVWTINLYLGGPEKLVRIAEGEPAPAGTPVTVRQLVLYADEEAAVDIDDEEDYGEKSGRHQGLDFRQLHVFDEWLADPEHLERVLPEPKGVVAMKPRRDGGRGRDDYDPMADGGGNWKTYFLIRNGGNVYRTTTDFNVGETLIPTADEFTALFEEETSNIRDGEWGDEKRVLKPGSWEWERAQEAADAKQRHYFRTALILQGLVDRTPIFHPLPEGGLSFLDQADHAAGKVRFLNDAENILGTGLEPFRDWQKRLNAQLRKGMRVILSPGIRSEGWSLNQHHSGYWYNPRLYPTTDTEEPETGRVYVIEDRSADGFIIRYPRTKEIYDAKMWIPAKDKPGWGYRGGYRTPKQRASARLQPDDKFVLPFDLITVEDCMRYLRSREQRPEYMDMVPVLKSAIRAKQREREMEEPFRVMLAGVLARENGGTVEEAKERVSSLVEWYKLANSIHRPLLLEEPPEPVYERLTRGGRKTAASLGLRPSQPQMSPQQAERMRKKAGEAAQKAVRLIVQEDARALKARKRPVNTAAVERLSTLYEEDTLGVARLRSGRYLILVRHEPGSPYVQEVEYDARGKEVIEIRPWRLPASNRVARWQVLWESEDWKTWPLNASPLDWLTGPEADALQERVREAAEKEGELIALCWNKEDQRYETWVHPKEGLSRRKTRVRRDEYEMAEYASWAWYRSGEEIKLRDMRYKAGTPAWKGDEGPWRRYSDDEDGDRRLVYVNRDLERKIYRRLRERDARRRRAEEKRRAAERYVEWVDAAWDKARWEEKRLAFVAETSAPELWEAERKMLEGSRRTGWQPDAVPKKTDAWLMKLGEALRDAGQEMERLHGGRIRDVAEVHGLDLEEPDPRVLNLKWDLRPECFRCDRVFEVGTEMFKRTWKTGKHSRRTGEVCAECVAELDGTDPDVEDEDDVDPDVLEGEFEEDHDVMALPPGTEE